MLEPAACYWCELDGLEFWPEVAHGGCGVADLSGMCRYQVYPEEDAAQRSGLGNVKWMSKKGREEMPARFLVSVCRPPLQTPKI